LTRVVCHRVEGAYEASVLMVQDLSKS
jgi:hypothetical protein